MTWVLLFFIGVPMPLILFWALDLDKVVQVQLLIMGGLAGLALYLIGSVVIGSLRVSGRQETDDFPWDARRQMYADMSARITRNSRQ